MSHSVSIHRSVSVHRSASIQRNGATNGTAAVDSEVSIEGSPRKALASPGAESTGLGHEELREHLGRARELLVVHGLQEDRRRELEQGLKRLEERLADPRAYLGVLGEFSSGKSTWINAILRQDLLAIDVLSATTSALTLIEHGPPSMEVEYLDGKRRAFVAPAGEQGSDWLRPLLKRFAAQEAEARKLRQVRLRYPAPLLANGLVLVDTPGSNVDNPRHVEEASRAAQELSDGFLVVVPADIPVSLSLVSFLRQALGDELARCLFLVTKLDRIEAGERPELLRVIRRRLSQQLDLPNPVLLPASPRLLLDRHRGLAWKEIPGSLESADGEALVAQSLASEARLSSLLVELRTVFVLDRSISLLDGILATLATDLEALVASRRREHEALEANCISDLQQFARKHKRTHSRLLGQALREETSKLESWLEKKHRKAEKELLAELRAVDSGEALRRVLTSGFHTAVKDLRKPLIRQLKARAKALRQRGSELAAGFDADFEEAYRRLAAAGGKQLQQKGRALPEIVWRDLDSASSPLAQIAETDEAEEIQARLKGAGIGAGIGLLFGGPVGAVLGGWLGSKLGGDVRGVSDAAKSHAPKLAAALSDACDSLGQSAKSSLGDASKALGGELANHIEAQCQRYADLAADLEREDLRRGRRLAKQRRLAERDLKELRQRRRALAEAREHTRRALGQKEKA